jgi:cyclopropane fatty-acyl-phospholipid synthase-like methyltransferase
MTNVADPFFEPYDREDVAYGEAPSSLLAAYIQQKGGEGRALDLGAGAGRNTIALAKAGYQVTAVDLSQRGLERLIQRAEAVGVRDRVDTICADARNVEISASSFDGIVAVTLLDHIPSTDANELWARIAAAATQEGFLFAEVHTREDPGCKKTLNRLKAAAVSETADAVINYFEPNQLLNLACETEANLRVLHYEERLEWDYTHGPEHLHGKAILLATRRGFYPEWYGQPPAFPRRMT